MQHDPVLVADTRAWLMKALTGLRMAEYLLPAVPQLLGGVVFHSQQAAEKALKGLRRRGLDVLKAREAGMLQARDQQHLAFA